MDDAWDKLQNETYKQYKYFCIYRDLGAERSIKKTAEIAQKQKSNLEKMSTKNHWVERASEYDKYMDKQTRIENEKEIALMNKRHIDQSLYIQKMLVKKLKSMNPQDILPKMIPMYYELAITMEREARGINNIASVEQGKQEDNENITFVDDLGKDDV